MSQQTIRSHPVLQFEKQERTIIDYARATHDWYVEPDWVVDKLLAVSKFYGPIHDPCCGQGNIPKRLRKLGFIDVTGSDIVDRGFGEIRDFMKDVRPADNLIFNPPYTIAEEFITHAIHLSTKKVAAIVNIKFLTSQGRRDRLFSHHKPSEVLVLSQRPSMPPGGTGIQARGGTADYVWIVWDNHYFGETRIRWLK